MSVAMRALRLVIGGYVRQGLIFLSACLITNGLMKPEQDFGGNEALVDQVVGGVILLATMAWTAIKKVNEKRVANTRAAMDAGATEAEAKQMVSEGKFASALTPPTLAPVITDNSTPKDAA